MHYYNTVDEIHVAVDRISEVAAAAGGAVAAQEESDSDDSSVDEWVHLTLSTALPVQGDASSSNSIEMIGASDFASECGECGEESIGGVSSDLSEDDADQHSLRASPANFLTSSAVSRPIAIRRTSAQARRGGRSGTPQSVSSSLGLHEVLAECERLSRTPPEFVIGSPPRVKESRAFTPALSAPKLTWEDIRSSTPPPIRHSSSFTAAWASGRTSGKSAHHNTDENVLPPQICRSL